jgi:hypothetical protein
MRRQLPSDACTAIRKANRYMGGIVDALQTFPVRTGYAKIVGAVVAAAQYSKHWN